VYVDRWIPEISQIFRDAGLDEQNTYLPEAFLDQVGTLYALDLTTRGDGESNPNAIELTQSMILHLGFSLDT
jgi:hypothetical protein